MIESDSNQLMKKRYGEASILLTGSTLEDLRDCELSDHNNGKTWNDIIRILIREHYELEEIRKQKTK
jgi:hypothetical protein